jgi:hypothetical protein
MIQPDGKELAKIAYIIDERKIKPIVTAVLPLADVRKAHEMSETLHTRGKIILSVREKFTISQTKKTILMSTGLTILLISLISSYQFH